MEEKYFKIHGHYVSYDDSPIQLTPRNQMMESGLSLLRAVARCVWFVLASFVLSLLMVLFVQPAKLSALLRVHWEEMREMK